MTSLVPLSWMFSALSMHTEVEPTFTVTSVAPCI